jgi:hypothetical protein
MLLCLVDPFKVPTKSSSQIRNDIDSWVGVVPAEATGWQLFGRKTWRSDRGPANIPRNSGVNSVSMPGLCTTDRLLKALPRPGLITNVVRPKKKLIGGWTAVSKYPSMHASMQPPIGIMAPGPLLRRQRYAWSNSRRWPQHCQSASVCFLN